MAPPVVALFVCSTLYLQDNLGLIRKVVYLADEWTEVGVKSFQYTDALPRAKFAYKRIPSWGRQGSSEWHLNGKKESCRFTAGGDLSC